MTWFSSISWSPDQNHKLYIISELETQETQEKKLQLEGNINSPCLLTMGSKGDGRHEVNIEHYTRVTEEMKIKGRTSCEDLEGGITKK
jgi:hypothetical protein